MVLGTKALSTPRKHQRLIAAPGFTVRTPVPGQVEDQTAGSCRERMYTGLCMPAVDAILHCTMIRLDLQGQWRGESTRSVGQ